MLPAVARSILAFLAVTQLWAPGVLWCRICASVRIELTGRGAGAERAAEHLFGQVQSAAVVTGWWFLLVSQPHTYFLRTYTRNSLCMRMPSAGNTADVLALTGRAI
mmetsp:Transcript_19776/g.52903  ORF Transcript_19776/g.52903 Transcript_19776/m.52903 type:complete len:106 (-) Transcript_19776:192-509(-)